MILLCLLQLLTSYAALGAASTWSEWWTYDGISGPGFWGVINSEQWWLCSKGKKQSPINIIEDLLLYDPRLDELQVDKKRASGTLMNTGHDVRFVLDEPGEHYINVSGGPLTYQYRVSEIIFHFGSDDRQGSEHKLNGRPFPAEIQILAYNTDIYGNYTQAAYSSHGIVMIALFVNISTKINPELEVIAQKFEMVRYKGKQVRIRHLSVHDLLPNTKTYITYEGSLTQPGCYETVTWIIMNKPIYISYKYMMTLRNLMQGEEDQSKPLMTNNYRPNVPLHQRPVRTNVNFENHSKGCTMEREFGYREQPSTSGAGSSKTFSLILILLGVVLARVVNSIWDRS